MVYTVVVKGVVRRVLSPCSLLQLHVSDQFNIRNTNERYRNLPLAKQGQKTLISLKYTFLKLSL